MRTPLTVAEKKLRDVDRNFVPDGNLTVNQLLKRLQQFSKNGLGDVPIRICPGTHYHVPLMIVPCGIADPTLPIYTTIPNGHTEKNCKLCRE